MTSVCCSLKRAAAADAGLSPSSSKDDDELDLSVVSKRPRFPSSEASDASNKPVQAPSPASALTGPSVAPQDAPSNLQLPAQATQGAVPLQVGQEEGDAVDGALPQPALPQPKHVRRPGVARKSGSCSRPPRPLAPPAAQATARVQQPPTVGQCVANAATGVDQQQPSVSGAASAEGATSSEAAAAAEAVVAAAAAALSPASRAAFAARSGSARPEAVGGSPSGGDDDDAPLMMLAAAAPSPAPAATVLPQRKAARAATERMQQQLQPQAQLHLRGSSKRGHTSGGNGGAGGSGCAPGPAHAPAPAGAPQPEEPPLSLLKLWGADPWDYKSGPSPNISWPVDNLPWQPQPQALPQPPAEGPSKPKGTQPRHTTKAKGRGKKARPAPKEPATAADEAAAGDEAPAPSG